jgi:lipopolysaccharide/colanic/teichoic acid biosynthesis glycosyltransferase
VPRWVDATTAAIALVVLSPALLVMAVAIALSSRGPVLYGQLRTGEHGRPFTLLKFRTMRVGADRSGRLTIGDDDPRTTAVGRVLRRHKLDELPQLWNVLRGDMALVGPRPEVPEYTRSGDPNQVEVLAHRPGLTDPASLAFRRESELLASSDDPDRYYRETVLPQKLATSAAYLRQRTVRSDGRVIVATALTLCGLEPRWFAAAEARLQGTDSQ